MYIEHATMPTGEELALGNLSILPQVFFQWFYNIVFVARQGNNSMKYSASNTIEYAQLRGYSVGCSYILFFLFTLRWSDIKIWLTLVVVVVHTKKKKEFIRWVKECVCNMVLNMERACKWETLSLAWIAPDQTVSSIICTFIEFSVCAHFILSIGSMNE